MEQIDKDDLDFAFRKIELLPTVAEYKGETFPVGKAIFDTSRLMALKHVSESFKLITNSDIRNFVETNFNVKYLRVSFSKGWDTSFISGIIKDYEGITDIKGNTYYISFEIANSYSYRFTPYIHLGLYNYNEKCFIKTFYPLIDNIKTLDIKTANIEFIRSVPEGFANSILGFTHEVESMYAHLPIKYARMLDDFLPNNDIDVEWKCLDHLNTLGKIANKWEKTSYELCATFQKNFFKRIFNIISGVSNG